MQEGGTYGSERIRYFDGGLFNDNDVVPLTKEELDILLKAARLNWASIEPAIFGTLFQRSLNPTRRRGSGIHYTSREDIETIVKPIVIEPLRAEWTTVKGKIERDVTKNNTKAADKKVGAFLRRLTELTILDPACGSGNFLYVSLRLLKDLEGEVIRFGMRKTGVQRIPMVHPNQLYGIELHPYATELASVVVWIGYLQWMLENGYSPKSDPILEPLKNIKQADAILDLSDPKHPKEPAWPAAEMIVGNPPFMGSKKLRNSLGDEYVDALFSVYKDRVPNGADLVCYWFEKARAMLEKDG